MPETKIKDLDKRVNSLEREMAGVKALLESIDKNVCRVADKMEEFVKEIEPVKMQVHDNTVAMETITALCRSNERRVDSLDKALTSMKSWLTGAVAVITVVVTAVQYLLDKFVF